MPPKITKHRERVRDELMKQIVYTDWRRDLIRLGPRAFLRSCTILRDQGGLCHTCHATIKEQVAKFLSY